MLAFNILKHLKVQQNSTDEPFRAQKELVAQIFVGWGYVFGVLGFVIY